MDGLSEGEMLSSNFWGRLSDTAVPSVVDDVKGFESKARRAQNEDCGHERAAVTARCATSPRERTSLARTLGAQRSRRHYISSLNNLDVTPAVIGGA